MVKKGADFRDPCLFDRIVEGYDVAFRPVDRDSAADVGKVAGAVLGTFDGIQMFLPDPAGRFPWQAECDPAYARIQTQILETVGEEPQARAVAPAPGLN
jgi:hypothetical protein